MSHLNLRLLLTQVCGFGGKTNFKGLGLKDVHLRLEASAAEDVSAVDDDGLVHDLVADEAVEFVGHREEPLSFGHLKVEILPRFLRQALKIKRV